jgi:hypothetical protein
MELEEWNTQNSAVSIWFLALAHSLIRTVCGDVQDVINAGATLQLESSCNMVCTGNDSYICGGSSRISYYTWTGDALNSWDFKTGVAAGEYEFLIGGKKRIPSGF